MTVADPVVSGRPSIIVMATVIEAGSITTVAQATRLKEDEKKIQVIIIDINVQIAIFRDLLIHIGTAKDAPELREKIRRVRRQLVEACKNTNTQLLPHVKSALAEGTILDNQQLICLYMLAQLLERELDKCLRLVMAMPMDMEAYFDSRPTTHGIGNVLTQIVLCKSMKPDFNAEEKVSIEKDTRELKQMIQEMAECLPKEDPDKARNGLTSSDGKKKWSVLRKKRKNGCIFNDMTFCCICGPSHLAN